MVFSQPFFIFCFLPIALLLYYCTGGSVLCMLTISLLFYACGATESVVLLLLLSLVTVILCITMEKTENPGHRRALLLLGIIMNGGALFYYKYFGFFVRQLSLFVPTLSLQNWSDAAMPLGISFFSFKAISLLTDVYRRTVSLEGRLLPGLSYLSFFGHIQSGPIARFGGGGWDIQRQLPSWEAFCNGLQRFAVGLAKKAILADSLAKIANNAFAVSPDSLSTGLAWLGAVSYALQLYYDFSGYSDMAIGLTGMFGKADPGDIPVIVSGLHRLPVGAVPLALPAPRAALYPGDGTPSFCADTELARRLPAEGQLVFPAGRDVVLLPDHSMV